VWYRLGWGWDLDSKQFERDRDKGKIKGPDARSSKVSRGFMLVDDIESPYS